MFNWLSLVVTSMFNVKTKGPAELIISARRHGLTRVGFVAGSFKPLSLISQDPGFWKIPPNPNADLCG